MAFEKQAIGIQKESTEEFAPRIEVTPELEEEMAENAITIDRENERITFEKEPPRAGNDMGNRVIPIKDRLVSFRKEEDKTGVMEVRDTDGHGIRYRFMGGVIIETEAL